MNMRSIYELADVFFQFLGELELSLDVLFLEKPVETRDYMTVYLRMSASFTRRNPKKMDGHT